MEEEKKEKVIIITVANNYVKSWKKFETGSSKIFEFLEKEEEDCTLSNETFSFIELNIKDIKNIAKYMGIKCL
jgi:hypothetical protein